MIKYLAIVTLSSSILTGCAPQSDPQTDGRQQKAGPWLSQNSSQAFGGQIGSTQIRGIFYSTTPPMGTPPSATGYWLRSQNTDYYAPITGITYNSLPVSNVTTSQGWLQVTAGGANHVVSGAVSLEFQLGAPVNGTLRITGSAGDPDLSYGQYVADSILQGDDDWAPFCPHPYLDSDDITVNLTEYMIPVGGAKWLLNGSRVDDSSAIQLSCTHDSIGGCVTWGYAPWATHNGVSLKNTHQACTRMKRADFCGTGDPLTTMNQSVYMHTPIQTWDALGINTAQPQTTATMEAYFNTSGATCFNPSEYRTTEPNAVAHMQELIGSDACPTLPACGKGSSGLVGSARPCTQIEQSTGNCIAN